MKAYLLIVCLLVNQAVQAKQPHWLMDIKTGKYEHNLEDWENYYGEPYSKQFAFGLTYQFQRRWQAGIELAYLKDKGQGRLPQNDILGGHVNHTRYPLHIFVQFRAAFSEAQIIVPYIGGGYTRQYYRQSIDNQPSVNGDVDGQHLRAGIQILLDRIDRGSSADMEADHHIDNTYLVIEAQRIKTETNAIDLGGDSLNFGLAFEF